MEIAIKYDNLVVGIQHNIQLGTATFPIRLPGFESTFQF